MLDSRKVFNNRISSLNIFISPVFCILIRHRMYLPKIMWTRWCYAGLLSRTLWHASKDLMKHHMENDHHFNLLTKRMQPITAEQNKVDVPFITLKQKMKRLLWSAEKWKASAGQKLHSSWNLQRIDVFPIQSGINCNLQHNFSSRL